MSKRPRIAVIGAGPAAHTVERLLEPAAGNVERFGAHGPSIWSIWSGYGEVYGPPSPLPPASTGAVECRRAPGEVFEPKREDRWRRLLERRGAFHPYVRIGVDRSNVERTIDRAVEILPDGLFHTAADGAVRPGPRGAPAVPDLLFPSLRSLAFRPGTTVSFVRAPGLSDWRAEAVAARVGRAEPIETAVVETPPFEDLQAGHPVRAARRLRELDDLSGALGDAVVTAASANEADVVVLPPVIGSTVPEHREWWASFKMAAAHYGARIAEFPAGRDPIFGWRLHRAFSPGEATGSDAPVESVECTGGRASHLLRRGEAPVDIDAVVLATGRWFSGGLPTKPPLVEPLTDVPIWLDGAPLRADPAAFVPDYIDELPWADHDLWRAGLATDRDLRVLDAAGNPLENVYAVGRALGGFNPFHDGCSLGVELVTATRTAVAIAERLDISSQLSPLEEDST